MVTISKYMVVLLLALLLSTSCSNTPSLQAYYVDNQEEPGFLSMDIPKSILNINEADLNEDELDALKSVDKLNMLAYKINEDNPDGFITEVDKVKAILETDKYDELLRGGNVEDGKFVVKYTGDIDKIKEFVLFGYASDKGFAVVRVLGKNMNPDKIKNLSGVMSKANIQEDAIKDLTSFFN